MSQHSQCEELVPMRILHESRDPATVPTSTNPSSSSASAASAVPVAALPPLPPRPPTLPPARGPAPPRPPRPLPLPLKLVGARRPPREGALWASGEDGAAAGGEAGSGELRKLREERRSGVGTERRLAGAASRGRGDSADFSPESLPRPTFPRPPARPAARLAPRPAPQATPRARLGGGVTDTSAPGDASSRSGTALPVGDACKGNISSGSNGFLSTKTDVTVGVAEPGKRFNTCFSPRQNSKVRVRARFALIGFSGISTS